MRTVLILVMAACLHAATPQNFERRKQEIRALLERDQFKSALEQATTLNQQWPDDITGYQLLAEAQLRLGKVQDAEKTIQWMLDLRIGKADAQGWMLVARLREATGDIEGALDAANLSYERLGPEQNREAAHLLVFVAQLQLSNGRTPLALEAAKAALKRIPDLASAQKILDDVYGTVPTLKKGKTVDEQIIAFETAFKKAPKDAGIQDRLAGTYLRKMRETVDGSYLARAQNLVTAVLRTDPENYEAMRRQAEINLQLHHFQKVIAQAGKLIKIRPSDTIAWGLMGDAMMERGDYDAAADAYQKMADLQPGLASYNRIAFYRFVTGDAEGAIEIMRRAIRLGAATPENLAWCLSDLGAMLLKTGQLDAAEQSFRSALMNFPGDHHAASGLGYVLAAKGNFEAAIQSFSLAQARAPLPEYSGALAKLYRKAGQNELATRQIAMLDIAERLDQSANEIANRNLALAFADLDHNIQRAVEIARAELNIRQDVYSWDALAWTLFKNGEVQKAGEAIKKALARNTPEPNFHQHAAQIFEAMGNSDLARQYANGATLCFDNFVLSRR